MSDRSIGSKLFSVVDFPLGYQTALFDLMIKSGASVGTNAKTMALQYFAPVYMYIAMCDIYPEREQDAIKELREHFTMFMRQYNKEYQGGEK